MPALARVLGFITATYSVAISVRPVLLARPCGLAEGPDQQQVSPAVRTLIGGIGARDAAIGAAMVLARRGPALRLAIAPRVASDLGDVVFFGSRLPDPSRRARVAGFAGVWAGWCALSARWAG
jgi:hypothetical protein